MSEDFDALSRSLQKKIDNAFDSAKKSQISPNAPHKKRRKLNHVPEPELAGGFITTADSDDTPGGFLPPSDEADHDPSVDDLIPFSLVPTALQILDLQPDDEEVLQVFKNAAEGWKNSTGGQQSSNTNDNEEVHGSVKRKDWRAVCAVLVGDEKEDPIGEETAGGFVIDDKDTPAVSETEDFNPEELEVEDGEDDNDEEDVYRESSLSSSQLGSESDSDEYIAGPSVPKSNSKSKGRKQKQNTSTAPLDTPTPRQKAAALEAFALFFPASPPLPESELIAKRLMFKDVVRIADLLREKIKAEEINEMLSLFSTSFDKSVSFEDFTRMMIVAKLA